MIKISEKEFNQLALDFAEVFEYESGSTVDYDVAGYQRVPRSEIDPKALMQKDIEKRESFSMPKEATFLDEPYVARLAGFRRREKFGPDEIGALLQDHRIAWNDGLGNGLFESLLINKKYGLRHVLEAPILGFRTPYVEEEWSDFPESYRKIGKRFIDDVQLMENIYGGKFCDAPKNLVVMWSKDYPLPNFMNAYKRSPEKVSLELEQLIGTSELPIQPTTPIERLQLIKFWSWVREKQAKIQIVQADILREMLGPNTQVISNPHELPVLDFAGFGRAFDIPSVAVRPLLIDDDVFLRHYIAYFSQLFHDLTEKKPMISVRMNLSAATPKFIPTGELIRSWYDQAVRHGASSFYFWTRDYPTNDHKETYDGPIPGNPIESTLPKERWETSLDILGELSTHKRFEQPVAEIAILVPLKSALLDCKAWRKIYATFSALAEQMIFANFLSDKQMEAGKLSYKTRMLIVPEIEFLSVEIKNQLEKFTKRGGIIMGGQNDLYDLNCNPVKMELINEIIDDEMFNIYPVDQASSREKLDALGEMLKGFIEKYEIDSKSWVFQVQYDNLPATSSTWMRKSDPSVYFAPWQYEHGSEWIMPYVKEIPESGK